MTMLEKETSTEFDSLMPRVGFSRRGFLVGSIAAGFALATQPVMAQTAIDTTPDGLVTGIEPLVGADRHPVPAYYARPEGKGPFPVVLVASEIFGVHHYIQDVCRRLAHQGYFAIAPDLFVRQGDPTKISNVQQILDGIVAKVPDAQVLGDLDAAVKFATAHGGDAKRLYMTGFCWGGRITWLYAAHNSTLRAAVAWYGKVDGAPSALAPKQPVDLAAGLTVPVLGLYGGKDQGIPLDDVEEMKGALKKGKSGSDIVVFPEAGHAFHADYRPSYRKAEAEEGWKRLLDWYARHGSGRG
ncbi:carboxymethylenebutenolidase [Oryzomicrobium terrae]|uniref:Carboxymethylenebutenolidase n=2 Tax=Oryzomicrobium terrae TaxID=1735038 RepID=A0A5C1EBI9_9RHOO|nr:carboxymethylenebutenolidase [Oryzomicrobium terrae]